VLTIYSPVQRAHQPAYVVVKQGERSASFDVPERVDSILSAINEPELGPVIAPDDAGLEPIRAVHDTGMIEYLMTAYERQNAEAGASGAVLVTLMWMGNLPPEHNPLIDEHVVYAVLLVGLALVRQASGMGWVPTCRGRGRGVRRCWRPLCSRAAMCATAQATSALRMW